MIHFFENQSKTIFAVQTQNTLSGVEMSTEDISKLNWLFADAHKIEKSVYRSSRMGSNRLECRFEQQDFREFFCNYFGLSQSIPIQ